MNGKAIQADLDQQTHNAIAAAIRDLRKTQPTPKTSPIQACLDPHADEIEEALARGVSAKTIADVFTQQRGMPFSSGSIRQRISRMFGSNRRRQVRRARGTRTDRIQRHVIYIDERAQEPPAQPARPSAIRVPPAQRARPAQRNS